MTGRLSDYQYDILNINLDLDLWKVYSEILLNNWAKFHENRTCTFWEIMSYEYNKQTNQLTNKLMRSEYILAQVTTHSNDKGKHDSLRNIVSHVGSSKNCNNCNNITTAQCFAWFRCYNKYMHIYLCLWNKLSTELRNKLQSLEAVFNKFCYYITDKT